MQAPPPRSRRAPGQRSLAIGLIGLGLAFLLVNLVPGIARTGLVLLGLGVAFLVGRVTTGRYGYAVPAGMLLGLGSFVSLRESLPGGGGWFFILLGVGFCLVYAIGARPAAVWPLIPGGVLIGLGLLFFAATAVVPLASLAWIAAYWPLVLVLIGAWLVLRDHLPGRTRQSVATLGTLTLLGYALLAAAASVAAGGSLARGGFTPGVSGAGAPFSDTLALDAPIAPGATLTLTNPVGRTTVRARAADAGGGVHVAATRHFSADPEPDVRLTPLGDGLTLQQSGREVAGFGLLGPAAWVDYDVEAPASVRVDLQAGSGDVDLDGLSGAVEVDAGSGGVKLANLAGPLEARSGSGGIDLTNATGEVRLTSGSGSLRGTGLQHLRAASTGSGSIQLSGLFADPAEVRSGSGNIELRLLSGSSLRIQARTQSGRLQVRDLPGLAADERSISGSLGEGSGLLSIESGSGSIVLSP